MLPSWVCHACSIADTIHSHDRTTGTCLVRACWFVRKVAAAKDRWRQVLPHSSGIACDIYRSIVMVLKLDHVPLPKLSTGHDAHLMTLTNYDCGRIMQLWKGCSMWQQHPVLCQSLTDMPAQNMTQQLTSSSDSCRLAFSCTRSFTASVSNLRSRSKYHKYFRKISDALKPVFIFRLLATSACCATQLSRTHKL